MFVSPPFLRPYHILPIFCNVIHFHPLNVGLYFIEGGWSLGGLEK